MILKAAPRGMSTLSWLKMDHFYPSEEPLEEGLAVAMTGIAFLSAVKAWWQE